TRVVTSRLRTRGVLMARRACLLRGHCWFVWAVAIEAILASFVPRVHERALFVTVGASLRCDRRSLVGMMALVALHRSVHGDRGHQVLRFGVTSNACRCRGSRRKRVAGQAFGLLLTPRVGLL